jgi:hypothetical protein
MTIKACDGASPLNKALQIFLGHCSFFILIVVEGDVPYLIYLIGAATSPAAPHGSCIAISIGHVRAGLVMHGTMFDW